MAALDEWDFVRLWNGEIYLLAEPQSKVERVLLSAAVAGLPGEQQDSQEHPRSCQNLLSLQLHLS